MTAWFENSTLRQQLLLWLLLVLIWGHSIHSGYIQLDTKWLIVDNPLLSVHSFKTFQAIWFDVSTGTRLTLGAEFLPVRDMTVWLDWYLFGESWGGHHLHSLLWYGASCSLLLSINEILFGRHWIVWLCTALFMLHPIHVESVVWLASRKDVVSLTFVLLAIRLYLSKTSTMWIGLVSLLAYWSKNTAIVVGPLLVLISICFHNESIWKTRWWLQWIPIVIPLAGGLWLTLQIGSSVAMFAEPRGDTALETLNVAAQTWFQYAGMILYPTQLSLFYAEPTPTAWTSANVALGICIALCIFLGAMVMLRINKRWTLALLTIPLGLLPVSQITPIQNLMADRYLLLPSIGCCWVLILLIEKSQSIYSRAWVVPLLWGIILGKHTYERIELFQVDTALWTDVTEKEPLEIRGWMTLASLYRDRDDLVTSQSVLKMAEQYHSNHPKLLLGQGMDALAGKKNMEAIQLFESAWNKDKSLREAGNNLAWLLQQSNVEASRLVVDELVKTHPLYATGWDTLGNTCLLQKDWTCAKAAFERSLRISPYRVGSLVNIGTMYYMQENWKMAKYWWTKALTLQPSHQYARKGLTAAKAMMGDDSP